MVEWIRHGDVIIERVDEIKGKGVPMTNVVLAEGEVTGHFHKLTGQMLVSEHEGLKYLDIQQDSILSHEEHDTLTIPKGKYVVRMQREVDVLGETRQVLD